MILDHIALATKDLEKAIEVWENLGLTSEGDIEEIKDQQVRTAFFPINEEAMLELVSPIEKSGPIQKFIEKKGEGIHHICFKVDDIKAKSDELKEKGFQLLYSEPVVGAHDCLINFIHPKTANGVLIELSQKRK